MHVRRALLCFASKVLTLQLMHWQEAAEEMAATTAEAQPVSAPAASPAGDDFAPAAAFAGARPGFAFQAGPLGLGYYREGSEAQRGTGFGAGVGSERAAERAAGTAEVCTKCSAAACLRWQHVGIWHERGESQGQHMPCLPGWHSAAAFMQHGLQLECRVLA